MFSFKCISYSFQELASFKMLITNIPRLCIYNNSKFFLIRSRSSLLSSSISSSIPPCTKSHLEWEKSSSEFLFDFEIVLNPKWRKCPAGNLFKISLAADSCTISCARLRSKSHSTNFIASVSSAAYEACRFLPLLVHVDWRSGALFEQRPLQE